MKPPEWANHIPYSKFMHIVSQHGSAVELMSTDGNKAVLKVYMHNNLGLVRVIATPPLFIIAWTERLLFDDTITPNIKAVRAWFESQGMKDWDRYIEYERKYYVNDGHD